MRNSPLLTAANNGCPGGRPEVAGADRNKGGNRVIKLWREKYKR